ncbi:hypothetical protein ACP4OV_020245 [Aristida adscensionis]
MVSGGTPPQAWGTSSRSRGATSLSGPSARGQRPPPCPCPPRCASLQRRDGPTGPARRPLQTAQAPTPRRCCPSRRASAPTPQLGAGKGGSPVPAPRRSQAALNHQQAAVQHVLLHVHPSVVCWLTVTRALELELELESTSRGSECERGVAELVVPQRDDEPESSSSSSDEQTADFKVPLPTLRLVRSSALVKWFVPLGAQHDESIAYVTCFCFKPGLEHTQSSLHKKSLPSCTSAQSNCAQLFNSTHSTSDEEDYVLPIWYCLEAYFCICRSEKQLL